MRISGFVLLRFYTKVFYKMFKIPSDRPNHLQPLNRLYKGMTPNDFITLFGNEYACVIVFLLSFCSKRFVNKVLKQLDIRDKEVLYEERVSCMIRNTLTKDYLPHLSGEMFYGIDGAVHEKLMDYRKKMSLPRGFRGTFKHPKEAVCKVSE